MGIPPWKRSEPSSELVAQALEQVQYMVVQCTLLHKHTHSIFGIFSTPLRCIFLIVGHWVLKKPNIMLIVFFYLGPVLFNQDKYIWVITKRSVIVTDEQTPRMATFKSDICWTTRIREQENFDAVAKIKGSISVKTDLLIRCWEKWTHCTFVQHLLGCIWMSVMR